MSYPWEVVQEKAARTVRLRLQDLSIKEEPAAYCSVYDTRDRIIVDRGKYGLQHTVMIDSLPLVVPFSTFVNPKYKTLMEHITSHVSDAVDALLNTLQFIMVADGTAGNYPHPEFFNYKVACSEYPNIVINDEHRHSDFYAHWEQFFETDDPQVSEIRQAYSDYYDEQELKRIQA